MNIQIYHKLIENPELLNKETLKDIEDLVKSFPMVENFRILLALNLLILNDYRYDAAITEAAIYSSDRKRLKEWVDYISRSIEEDTINKAKAEVAVPVKDKEIETLKKDAEEATPNEPSLIQKVPERESEEKEKEELAEQEEPVKRDQDYSNRESNNQEEENNLKDIAAEKKSIRTKKELLKLVRKRLDEIEAANANEKEVKAEGNEQFIKAKLIDRFIEQQPSINRPDKNDFFDPQSEAVESSIDEDDFFVTETLAQIHTQQGNLKKAEEIYRKLILKNPEKSSYFAAQIEKLTKK